MRGDRGRVVKREETGREGEGRRVYGNGNEGKSGREG